MVGTALVGSIIRHKNLYCISGDIVFFDRDGYFYVVDRIKNIIKVDGLQVSPLELVIERRSLVNLKI